MHTNSLGQRVAPVRQRFPSLARRVSVVLLGALSFLGCGGPHTAQVTGTATLDNQPLTTGTVTFHPADGKGALAYGQIDAQGRYQLSTGTDAGLAPGAYIAVVVATEPIPLQSPTEEQQFRPITPAKYQATGTSDLKVEVKPGPNDIPLVLKTQP